MRSVTPRRAERRARARARTRAGLSPAVGLLGLGVLLTLAGAVIAGETVTVPGAGLTLLAAGCLLWVRALAWRTRVWTRPETNTLVEGATLRLEVGVRAPRRLAGARIELRHPFLAGPLEVPGGAHRVGVEAITSRRGRLVLDAAVVSVADPFGYAHARGRAGAVPDPVLVLPRTEPVRWSPGWADQLRPGRRGTQAAGEAAFDLVGLRPYVPGAPVSRIHWPSLARGGDLLERTFAGETEAVPLLILDGRCPPGAQGAAELDALVRATASLALALASRGGVDVLLGGQRAPTRVSQALAGWPSLQRALAVLEPSDAAGPAPALGSGRTRPVILAGADPERTQRQAAGLVGQVVVLTPDRARPVGAGPVVLRVAGCTGRAVRRSR